MVSQPREHLKSVSVSVLGLVILLVFKYQRAREVIFSLREEETGRQQEQQRQQLHQQKRQSLERGQQRCDGDNKVQLRVQ